MATKNVERFVRSDKLGNDPLRHTILSKLDQLTRFTLHTVTPDEQGNPAVIADVYYNNPDFDFLILAYNGIGNGMSLVAGQQLKIPAQAQVDSLTTMRRTRTTRI